MFDAAARHLNFRLAAEELHLTQGAVAQRVRRLEADLGFRLFERHARGLAFTEIGRRYHDPVRRALLIIDEATNALRPQSTRVALSVTPSFASRWLVPRLREFSNRHPDIEVQTVASEKLADFRSDGIDVAIRHGRPPFGERMRVELLEPLDLCAVCSPDLAAAMAPITRLEDFTGHPLLQDGHNLWDALFEEAGVRPSGGMMHFHQTALAMDAAANGQGIALAPRLLLGAEITQGRLVELWRDARPDRGGFYVLCPEIGTPTPARDALIEWILGEVRGARVRPRVTRSKG